MEFAIVLFIRRILNRIQSKNMKSNQVGSDNLLPRMIDANPIRPVFAWNQKNSFENGEKECRNILLSPTSIEDKVDLLSLLLFPISFAVYNYCYWNTYLK